MSYSLLERYQNGGVFSNLRRTVFHSLSEWYRNDGVFVNLQRTIFHNLPVLSIIFEKYFKTVFHSLSEWRNILKSPVNCIAHNYQNSIISKHSSISSFALCGLIASTLHWRKPQICSLWMMMESICLLLGMQIHLLLSNFILSVKN